jgi:hypothetical protein
MRQYCYLTVLVAGGEAWLEGVPRNFELPSDDAQVLHVLEPSEFNPGRRIDDFKLERT